MDLIINILLLVMVGSIIYLIIQQRSFSKKLNPFFNQNSQLLESIEKYIEIFNEQNVNDLLKKENDNLSSESQNKMKKIREEYRMKLVRNNEMSEEHEMLIDFISLSLSLLIKTPPSVREKIIRENTDNEYITKILVSKLPEIQNHFVPVSILEVALSKQNV